MKIIALESSAVTASVAVTEDDRLLAQSFQNSGLTHSATLMPMVSDLLKNTGLTLDEMDVVAVAAGPGSFTGVRIGVAAAKGLAWPGDKPCAPCSTLESMAWQCAHMGGEICAAMDARRNQVYCARFSAENGELKRLTDDRAMGLDELAEEIRASGKLQTLVGDGAHLVQKALEGQGLPCAPMPPHLIYQTAWGVARCALRMAQEGRLVSAAAMAPSYHRLSQAERERLEKLNAGQ
ncbi:MAG: tRNA (adenosine(37)-N6)-threonylcarbamoyltransferase complex dimerization subunit type 1 TsaB [Oscillospiraceae bacterium]|nr:tRNA (adenosine(37)-N6)-threonylcarbamoyltransferase complex dimerization subunit type 1 TsaB [Oscillospiraceae bacterium]